MTSKSLQYTVSNYDFDVPLQIGRRLPADTERLTGGLSERLMAVESDEMLGPHVERQYGHTGQAAQQALGREVAERRDQTAALVRLSELYREIDQAVIRQSTREEIDQVVCEHLVESGWYAAAWVGDVNLATAQIVSRAVAGVPTERVDAVPLDADDDVDVLGTTIASTATDGETRVVRVGADCDDPEAVPAFVRDRGYRWMAAVPLTFEGIRYGVLTLFSDRADAFGGYEWRVLEGLGRTVGHAISAIERKQALIDDRYTELEIQIPDVVRPLDRLCDSEAGDQTITVEETILADDDKLIQYLTVTGLSLKSLREAMAELTETEAIRELGRAGDSNRFEVTYADFPTASTLASYGGRIETVCFDVPDLRITVALPQRTDVRQIYQELQSEVPDLRIGAQRSVTRPSNGAESSRDEFEAALTEHQRTALTTAFFAGYFDWPRKSTGEEIAETLDISPSTFHQHLRIAQQKVFSTICESERSV